MTQLNIDFPSRRGHAARVENSPRLRKVLALLMEGGWHSTREISRKAEVYAAGSCISELRANGYDIECRAAGRGRYEYRLVKEGV